MIKKERIEEMMQVADAAMASTIKDLPKLIKSKTNGAVAGMFGFENSNWDKWKIDHCNGRMSEVSGWISTRAKELFAKEMEKVITKKFVKEMVTSAKSTIQKEFKEMFLREFRCATKDLAKKHAEEEAKNYMEGFKLSLKSQIDEIAQAAMAGNLSETELAIMESEIVSSV